jgi:hypothetical protein
MKPSWRFLAVCQALAWSLIAWQVAEQQKSPREIAHGQTVLLGTFAWEIETDSQQGFGPQGPDVSWDQVRVGEQYLTPLGTHSGGAKLARVTTSKAFDALTVDDLLPLTFSTDRMSGTDLKPGVILALRTTEGNLAKLKVVGYRSTHDFSFGSAKYIAPERRAWMLSRPNVDHYHLELAWLLWEIKPPAKADGLP